MNQLKNFFSRHSLVIGIVLMFLMTWPINLANAGAMPFEVPFVVYITLGYGFVFASIIMTWITLGKDAVVTLLKRFLIYRVGWKWYLVAFLLIPAMDILAIYLNAVLTKMPVNFSAADAYEIFGQSANLTLLIVPFFLFDALTNGEETGWRGYVLPRLQAKYSALTSSLILGVIWSIWHLPKFVNNWESSSFMWYVVDTMGLSVLLTWLYNNTKGSLLLVTLFHASINTAGVMLPMDNMAIGVNMSPSILATLLTTIAAGVVTVVAGAEHLSRTMLKQVQEDQQNLDQEFTISPRSLT